MSPPTPIILLKTKSKPTDPYDTLFRSSGKYEPIFVPVMQHTNTNLDRIRDLIVSKQVVDYPSATSSSSEPAAAAADESLYGGLVITSQRTVEAVGSVLEELKDSNPTETTSFLSTTLIYVVGPATHRALLALGFNEDLVRGKQAGHGGALAEYMLEDYKLNNPLLFLTGETHGTVIPHKMAERQPPVKVEEVVVYKTGVVEGFEGDFRRVLDDVEKGGDVKGEEVWIIVFSPTGTGGALNVLEERRGDAGGGGANGVGRKGRRESNPDGCAGAGCEVAEHSHGNEKEEDGKVNGEKDDGKKEEEEGVQYRICTIGPTTKDFMWQSYKRKPDAVAKSPSPEGLLEAIKEGVRIGLEVVL